MGIPQTKDQENVRSFLGLAGYYWRSIPDFSMVVVPLTQLTRKGQPDKVNFNQLCHGAFMQLKAVLMTQPVLKVANPQQPFILQTDVSEFDLDAVLSQKGEDGEEHPVAYASRKLFLKEMNYSVIEKECLVIVWALAHFTVYLEGQQFALQTNHQPLAWLQRMKNANQRLTQ